MNIQLMLENSGLKCMGPLSVFFFFPQNMHAVLHDLWLVEPVDMEPQIQGSDEELYVNFRLRESQWL